MPPRDPLIWMWAEACQHLDRAERLHRGFFEPSRSAGFTSWEPPIDIFDAETQLVIEVALPGVDPRDVVVAVEGADLIVGGERKLPRAALSATIRRLEVPYGRFERRIPLPPGRYEVAENEVAHGCLLLILKKMA